MPFDPAKQRNSIALMLLFATASYAWSQTPTASLTPAQFAVASIRLSPANTGTRFSPRGSLTFTATGATLTGLLVTAFGVGDSQILGLPAWSQTVRYDVTAKPDGDKALEDAQFQDALQQLLKERLHLAFHRDTKMVEGYRLVAGKSVPKLTPSKGGRPNHTELDDEGTYASNVTLDDFSSALSSLVVHDPVVNQTGIEGSFEINLKFATNENTDSSLPSIFTAVQEQLGLKLERTKVPVEMIVIDHVDREPTEN